jgi:hypothetical protein
VTSKSITIEKTFGDKTVSKTGSAIVVESQEDVLTLLSEDASAKVPDDATDAEKARIKNRVVRAVNYALDLWTRAKLTQQINSENVDPTKATDKAFTDFNKARLANGKPALSEEKFRELMSA